MLYLSCKRNRSADHNISEVQFHRNGLVALYMYWTGVPVWWAGLFPPSITLQSDSTSRLTLHQSAVWTNWQAIVLLLPAMYRKSLTNLFCPFH